MDYTLLQGDVIEVLKTLPSNSVQCCVTSPPYWGLRDYGTASWEGGDEGCDHSPERANGLASSTLAGGKSTTSHAKEGYRTTCRKCGATRIDNQIGLEPTPQAYVAKMVAVFDEVRRVLRDDGTCWLNLGDSYSGSGKGPEGNLAKGMEHRHLEHVNVGRNIDTLKPKDLCGIPWRVAFALQDAGWWLRSAITWCKTSAMPESVKDRPTRATEQIFLLTKRPTYYYDQDAIRTESGANARDYWIIGPEPFSGWTQTSRQERVELDAVSDDTICKVSSSCRVHGGLLDQIPTASSGVRVDILLHHRVDNGSRPVRVRVSDSSSIDQIYGEGISAESLDSVRQQYASSAIAHSNQRSKTDLVLQTSLHDTAYAQIPFGIGYTLSSAPPFDSAERTHENNTLPDDLAGHLSARTQHHNASMFSLPVPPECTCSFYHEVTDKTTHFATFPTELPERCIKASTSAHGCCAKCGSPWERVTEQQDPVGRRDNGTGDKHVDNGMYSGRAGTRGTTTLGWQPTCTCNAEVVPCTVLDPFAGSGTTVAVAMNLGRVGIGIELNPQYIELAHRRIRGTQPALIAV